MSVFDKNGVVIRVGDIVKDISDGKEAPVTRIDEYGSMGQMVWSVWEGKLESWVSPENLVVITKQKELTLEMAIDFIASLGYTVTITKN